LLYSPQVHQLDTRRFGTHSRNQGQRETFKFLLPKILPTNSGGQSNSEFSIKVRSEDPVRVVRIRETNGFITVEYIVYEYQGNLEYFILSHTITELDAVCCCNYIIWWDSYGGNNVFPYRYEV
jgi:hypothetical protein